MAKPSLAHSTVTDRWKPGRTATLDLLFPASIPLAERPGLTREAVGTLRRVIYWKDDLSKPVGWVEGQDENGRLVCQISPAAEGLVPDGLAYELTATVTVPGHMPWWNEYRLVNLGLHPVGSTYN